MHGKPPEKRPYRDTMETHTDVRETGLGVGTAALGVGHQGVVDPGEKLAELDIDAGVSSHGTALTPGHQAVDLALTHQGAP